MEKIQEVQQDGLKAIEACSSLEQLNQVRIDYLGKKGHVQSLMALMKDLSKEEKPVFGQKVNVCKQTLTAALEQKQEVLKVEALKNQLVKEKIDITLPGYKPVVGTVHPLMMIQQELEDLFVGMGYSVAEGPEIELDLYNFERANLPKDHPARDMQDTFYITPQTLLRTHTTAIQMRVLEASKGQLPIKLICPGKVYRRDDDDSTHSHQFMQMEGLVVGENITLADLKGTLKFFAQKMFGEDREIRFRPSYFPFT